MTDLDALLRVSSRTFALSIPLLPGATREQVTIAYLLFRIADTIEDAVQWSREERLKALGDFDALVSNADDESARSLTEAWLQRPPLDHPGYLQLMEKTPEVIAAFSLLDQKARSVITSHLQETTRGMARFIGRADASGSLQLHAIQDLRDYCYVVAGLVGEMLTGLFIHNDDRLQSRAVDLQSRARAFGEALQLTNILKDSNDDGAEGRTYLPKNTPRSEVLALARRDLVAASEYVTVLQEAQADRGVIAFNALPLLLARATLDRVEAEGPGAKITRPEVFRLVDSLNHALDHGHSAAAVR